MCGPLVIMVGRRWRGSRWSARIGLFSLYHSGRVLVYMLLAAGLGAVGGLLGAGSNLSPIGGGISLALGLGVVLFGLGYLGILPTTRFTISGEWLNQLLAKAFKSDRKSGALMMGMLNGLLPCGLVYSALLTSASLGGAVGAALGMGAFGLGTWPVLFLIGMGGASITLPARQRLFRVAGLFIVLIGGQLIFRGLATMGWIPHARLGGWMLW